MTIPHIVLFADANCIAGQSEGGYGGHLAAPERERRATILLNDADVAGRREPRTVATLNRTTCFSDSLPSPDRCSSATCTNTSFPGSSGWMNPYPFVLLFHFSRRLTATRKGPRPRRRGGRPSLGCRRRSSLVELRKLVVSLRPHLPGRTGRRRHSLAPNQCSNSAAWAPSQATKRAADAIRGCFPGLVATTSGGAPSPSQSEIVTDRVPVN